MKSTTNRMDVEEQVISEATAARLINQKTHYFKSKQQFISNYDYDDTTTYFLLSTKFLNEWKKYSGYDETNINYRPRTGAPPGTYNNDLLFLNEMKETKLRPGLLQGQDYEIVSQDMMTTFGNYKGEVIEKTAYKLSNGKKLVEIYGVDFKYFYMSQRVMGEIDTGVKQNDLNIRAGSISRYVTLKQGKKGFMIQYDKLFNKDNARDVKLWKMDRDMTPKKYYEMVKKVAGPQMRESYRIKHAYATVYDREDLTVEDLALTEDDYLLVEVREVNREWVIKEGASEETCELCRKYVVLNVECGCKRVRYCSQECKSRDVMYHRKRCSFAEEEEIRADIDFGFEQNSNRGVCGLSNLGNTCFMNSCLQCLSNSVHLTEYFISKRYVKEINTTNPIGTKGQLTSKYAKMIQALWCSIDSVFSPYMLKNSISDFQPMFSGYNQHDSQELLSFLLDGLHQDLNRVINKPYVESVDYDGQNEHQYAMESWQRYLMRNKSIIVDLFMGQYKSKVVCPDCHFESITFDPYSTISLPIPQTTKVSLEVFVFYSNYRETPKKIVIEASGRSIESFREQVSKSLSLDPGSVFFYILSFDGECQEFATNDNVDRLVAPGSLSGKSGAFVVELSREERMDLKNSVLIYSKFCKVGENYIGRVEKQTISFKRPFYYKFNKLTGHHVYLRMFTFLYRLVYSGSPPQRSSGLSSGASASAPSPPIDPEVLMKSFQKHFADPSKLPFSIYLMSEPKINARNQTQYYKQQLIQLNTNVGELLIENGQLKKVEFEIRFSKKQFRDQIKKLNTYEDCEKGKKVKGYDEDNAEYAIEECFREFQKTEKLEVGNEWRCPKCKDFKQAYKSMSLYKTPKILVLHLKRFKQKSTFLKSKIGALVRCPKELDLDGFVINKTLPEAYFAGLGGNVNAKESSKYQLYAVSNHFGTMGGGHYTAYAKNNDVWYDFNDSQVTKVSAADIITSAAYMLFYRRID